MDKKQKTPLTTGKSLFFLLVFQILGSIIFIMMMNFFADLSTMISGSIVNNQGPSLMGIILGSVYFGMWVEKKHPGTTTIDKKLDKLAATASMVQVVLGALGLCILMLINGDSLSLVTEHWIAATIIPLVLMVIFYYVIKFSISRGVKFRNKFNGQPESG